MNREAPVFYLDHREGRSRIPLILRDKGMDIRVVNDGQITDYIIDMHCRVERKTVNNFF